MELPWPKNAPPLFEPARKSRPSRGESKGLGGDILADAFLGQNVREGRAVGGPPALRRGLP